MKIVVRMKKIISALVLCIALASCSPEGESYSIEVLPIAKVEMQSAFAKDSVTIIPLKYIRPSNCYFYEDIYYQKQGLTRTVAIYNSKLNRDDCQTMNNDSIRVFLNFMPTQLGTYTFKFWKGTNASGQDLFDEYEVEVNH